MTEYQKLKGWVDTIGLEIDKPYAIAFCIVHSNLSGGLELAVSAVQDEVQKS